MLLQILDCCLDVSTRNQRAFVDLAALHLLAIFSILLSWVTLAVLLHFLVLSFFFYSLFLLTVPNDLFCAPNFQPVFYKSYCWCYRGCCNIYCFDIVFIVVCCSLCCACSPKCVIICFKYLREIFKFLAPSYSAFCYHN